MHVHVAGEIAKTKQQQPARHLPIIPQPQRGRCVNMHNIIGKSMASTKITPSVTPLLVHYLIYKHHALRHTALGSVLVNQTY